MAVCGWMGMVFSLSDRLYAIFSMNGIEKLSPGVAVREYRPKRSICHSSACGTMRTTEFQCRPSRPMTMSRAPSARAKRGRLRRLRRAPVSAAAAAAATAAAAVSARAAAINIRDQTHLSFGKSASLSVLDAL